MQLWWHLLGVYNIDPPHSLLNKSVNVAKLTPGVLESIVVAKDINDLRNDRMFLKQNDRYRRRPPWSQFIEEEKIENLFGIRITKNILN